MCIQIYIKHHTKYKERKKDYFNMKFKTRPERINKYTKNLMNEIKSV